VLNLPWKCERGWNGRLQEEKRKEEDEDEEEEEEEEDESDKQQMQVLRAHGQIGNSSILMLWLRAKCSMYAMFYCSCVQIRNLHICKSANAIELKMQNVRIQEMWITIALAFTMPGG
jgi:hypothetical protein